MKKSWNIKSADKMPPRRGAGIQEDTRDLIKEIIDQGSPIVELTFSTKAELRKYFNRLKYAKKHGAINYKKISRRGDALFIELGSEHEK